MHMDARQNKQGTMRFKSQQVSTFSPTLRPGFPCVNQISRGYNRATPSRLPALPCDADPREIPSDSAKSTHDLARPEQ